MQTVRSISKLGLSMLSSNTTVIIESPSLEIERTVCICGSPINPVSSGKVTSCSTSVGDMPGASTVTTTWVLVRSGNASIGIFHIV